MLKEKSSAKKIQIIFDLNFVIHEKKEDRRRGNGYERNESELKCAAKLTLS